MNKKTKTLKNTIHAGIALSALAIASPALATISIELDPSVTPDAGGGYDWSYTATFVNSFTQSNESRIALFDFEGYVAGFEVTPVGWTFTTAPTGPAALSAAAALAVPSHQDTGIANLIWNFTGVSGSTSDFSMLEFGARSLYGETLQRSYGTRDRADSGSAETNSASQGPTHTPTTSAVAVPDQGPSIAITSSIGLLLLGLARFRNRAKTGRSA